MNLVSIKYRYRLEFYLCKLKMTLKEEFVIDLQAFICYYRNNKISYDPVQVYLNKYHKLFNRYKIYLYEI